MTCYVIINKQHFLDNVEEQVYDLKDYFKSLSKNLSDDSNPIKKQFQTVDVNFIEKNGTLEDNAFSDITTNDLSSNGIAKINSKAFGKAAQTISRFWCE